MKTDEQKELQGTRRPDKDPVLDASMALTKLPKPPAGFTPEQIAIWKDIGKKLILNGILTNLDIPQLTRYCQFSAMYNESLDVILDPITPPQVFYKFQNIAKMMEVFESTYGLTPKSRKMLGVGAKKKNKSKLSVLISKKRSTG